MHKRKILRHVRPGTRQATGAHYDLVYLRGGTANVYTSWLPLGDCPVEEGGLIYLEGSHQQFRHLEQNSVPNNKAAWLTKDLPSLASRHNTRWLIGDYEAGDMVIHTAYTVHASLNNNSSMERFRLSTDIRYQLLSDTIDLRWQNHWRDDDGL